MTFSDDDLKRLKECARYKAHAHPVGDCIGLLEENCEEKWQALLDRLEASEQVAKNARELIVSIKLGTDTPFEIDEVTRSLEAWLRSKGEQH